MDEATKKLVEIRSKFSEKVKAIENKHIDFFKERKAAHKEQKHDSIENHFILKWDSSGKAEIAKKGDDLPDEIYTEVIQAFFEVFGK